MVLPTEEEEEVTITRKEQILIVLIVENLDTKPQIADSNNMQMWQKICIKILVRILITHKVYFWQVIHFQKKKIFGIWILGVVIICVERRSYFFQ